MINPAEGGDFHLAKTGDLSLAVDRRERGSKACSPSARYLAISLLIQP